MSEGDSGSVNAVFAVSLSAAGAEEVTVVYATGDGTAIANGDYTAVAGTVSFPAGTTGPQTITVAVNGDTDVELDETFFVNLTSVTNATLTDTQGLGVILNDDVPSVSVGDVSVGEGDSGSVNALFTVSLSAAGAEEVTVVYATADGTAAAGSDYTVGSGTVSFPAGSTGPQTITVAVNGDTDIELDETFFVNLTSASNATIADSQGMGTILNDDFPAVSIDDVSVSEGDGGSVNAVFTVSLSAAGVQEVTVDYITAAGTAAAGSDYTAGSGTVSFPAGSTGSQTITVAVNGDTDIELDETFLVNLTGATNATLADAQGMGTILNDDIPSVSIDDVSVGEGDSGSVNAVFTVSLSAAGAQVVTVGYASGDGSATEDSDYVTCSGTVTFPAGTTNQNISVAVNGDTEDEPNETFFVNLSNPINASIPDSRGTGTIIDDDAPLMADLAITKTGSADPVAGGDTLTYTLTVINNGPSQATGVTVTDGLPAGLSYVSSSPDSCTYSYETVTCSLGSLADGAETEVTITTTVDEETRGSISNTANVGGDLPDPDPSNNSDKIETTVVAEPTLSLDKSTLHFNGTSDGSSVTGPQTVRVRIVSISNAGWSVTSNMSFIDVAPQSGSGNGSFTVSVDAASLPQTSWSGTVTVSSAETPDETVIVSGDVYQNWATGAPFGSFDTPADWTMGISGAVAVTGWVLDDIEVGRVEIWRDPVPGESGPIFIADAILIEGARPDIEVLYAAPCDYRAGWGYMLLTNFLPPGQGATTAGNGTYVLHAYAYDKEGNRTHLGSKTIIVDNQSATKPFGTIDTPAQGGEASGSAYINFGWALTPQPNTIPADGSTISVWVDGVNIGNASYDDYRPDVESVFGGHNNSGGAGGHFYIDTTGWPNGVHTIGWFVQDDAGNADGVGSRFFRIEN